MINWEDERHCFFFFFFGGGGLEKNAGGCRIRFLLMDIFEWKRMACFFPRR